MLPIKSILHATDFSEQSAFAFPLACSLAQDYKAHLIVLYVAEPPLAVAGDGLLMLPVTVDYEPLREKLHNLRPHDPMVRVEHRLVEGQAATEILRVAGEAKCDLIVMGTHGRTGLGRLLMGSVAEEVARKARCPVLTVKAPPTEAGATTEPSWEMAASGAVASKGQGTTNIAAIEACDRP